MILSPISLLKKNKIMQRVEFPFSALDKAEYEELDSDIQDLVLISQKTSTTSVSPQEEINIESLSNQNQISTENPEKVAFTKEAIEKAISMNTQKSPLTHSLIKRTAFGMEHKSAKPFLSLSDSKIGIYSIKSYTYNSIIEVPVRGANCTHYDVVDLEYLIREVAAKGWRCPLCNKKIQLGTLCIDKQLKKELVEIAKLPDGQQPDILLYDKVNNKFLSMAYRAMKFDEVVSEPFDSNLVEKYLTPMYEVSNLWITPDKHHFEIFFEIPKPKSNKKSSKEIIIVPVVILGDKVSVNGIKELLITQKFSGVEVRYVVYVPTAHNFGYNTQTTIIKSVLDLSEAIKVVVLADGNSGDELLDYFDDSELGRYLASPQKGFIMYKGKESKLEKEGLQIKSGIIMEIDDAEAIDKDLKAKIEELKPNKKSNKGSKNKGFAKDDNDFLNKIQDAFENNFRFHEGKPNKMSPIIGTSGVILRFEINHFDDFLENYSYIQVLNIDKEKDYDLYKIKVSQSAVEKFTNNKALKVYFPGKISKTRSGAHTASDLIRLSGTQVDSYEDVILPMLLADFTSVFYDGSERKILECIIKAKEVYPELNSKVVIVHGKEQIKDLIAEKSTEEEKDLAVKPLIKQEHVTKISDIKYFCWKYNIFLRQIMGEAPTDIKKFWSMLRVDIKELTPNEDSSIVKGGKDDEEKKNVKSDPSITLKQAIAGKLSALGADLVSISKDERTTEEIVFAVSIAHNN